MSEIVMEGRVLAEKYEITRLLGQGGMGAVYEARNHLGKRFAVKLLLKQELMSDPQLIQRFFREAKASAAIESEHIVEVYDTGVDPGTRCPFIIMELLKGEDLEHTIARVGALNPMAAARVISQAAEGLGHAHAAGIVHRDIKPANIFMTMRGPGDLVVKILDFGIAKQAVEQLSNADAGLTKTGSMLGTPLYMSPEQARGLRTIDARTDIWSLGMCLYEALSGRTPWGNVDTLGDLILSICARDVMPLQEAAPWVPPELCAVVHRALARDVGQRTGSAQQLIEQLTPFMQGSALIAPDILTGVGEGARNAPPMNTSTTGSGRTASPHVSSVSAMTSSQPGTGTGVSSTGERPQPKRPSTGLLVGVAAAAVIVLAVGGFAVSKAIGGKKTDDTNANDQSGQSNDDPPSDPTDKKVDPPSKPTTTAATATATATETATASATTTAPTVAETATAPQPTATGKTIKKFVPSTATAKPQPTATATATAAPATTSTGRKITESL